MGFEFRAGTADRAIFDAIMSHNEYRLPARFAPGDVVVDVGAHIGCFSYAALRRGAGRVYAYEADQANFALAQRNLAPFGERARVALRAVWRSDRTGDRLFHGGYADGAVTNTGGGSILWSDRGDVLDPIAFDEVLRTASEDGRRRVRLVKLDCEGSEWPILFTCTRLDQVDALCGEFHELAGPFERNSLPAVARVGDYERYLLRDLCRFLKQAGFHVTAYRHTAPDGAPQPNGMFFATRDPEAHAGVPEPLEAQEPPARLPRHPELAAMLLQLGEMDEAPLPPTATPSALPLIGRLVDRLKQPFHDLTLFNANRVAARNIEELRVLRRTLTLLVEELERMEGERRG